MSSIYRDKIISELDSIPEASLPDVYQMLHLLKTRFLTAEKGKKSKKSGKSLEGIWKGTVFDEDDFAKARRSLFPYENR